MFSDEFIDLKDLIKDKNIDMLIEKRKVGRPRKYNTPEEYKEAKKKSNISPEEIQRRNNYNKEYYHNTKILNEKCHNKSIHCDCGGLYQMYNLKHHLSTQKHQKYIKLEREKTKSPDTIINL